MGMGHFLRLGDKTTCGGTVLEGESGYLMDGIPRALEGAKVSCGADGEPYAIVGGIHYITSDGRQVAGTLDSISSCPCAAALINSCFGAVYESSRLAPPVVSKSMDTSALQGFAAVAERSTTPVLTPVLPVPIGSMGSTVCNHPDQMEILASYIAGEMNTNISHSSVLEMRELMDFDPHVETAKYKALPFYMRLGREPDLYSLALAKRAKALAIWVERVGQDRPWDHKPMIRKKFGGVRHKQGLYDYYYDIWSNIHYGYVGTAAGLSESALLDGAGAEQIPSDILRKYDEMRKKDKVDWKLPGPHPTAEPWTQLRSWDDVADRIAIGLGIKFHQQFSVGGVTSNTIMDAVLAVEPMHWGDGVTVHICK